MLHESIRHLVATHGPAVLEDADHFRALLDDVVGEDEATSGQINLLVDAVRLGAVRRLTDVLSHGATEAAALDEAGSALARDRGSEDSRTASWALAVLGYALGRLDVGQVRALAGPGSLPGPSSTPVPDQGWWPGAPAPVRPGPQRADQWFSEAATMGRAAGGSEPEALPERPRTTERPDEDGRSRERLVPALVVLTAVLVAVVTGLVVVRLGGSSEPPSATEARGATNDVPRGGNGRTRGVTSPEPSSSPPSSSPTDPPADPEPTGEAVPESELLVDYFGDGLHQIYAVDTEPGSGTLRPVTQEADDDELPSISPDRSTISFIRKPTGDDEEQVVWLADADGDDERVLYPGTDCIYSTRPAWSPDGTQIAVVCFSDGATLGLYVSSYDGSGLTRVLAAPSGSKFIGAPTWISDDELVYGRSEAGSPSELWRLDLGTDDTEPITDGGGEWDSRPDWSAEAGEVLFMRTPEETDDFGALMAYDPATDSTQVIPTEVEVAHPVWSPDGSQIAVCYAAEDGNAVGILRPAESALLSTIDGPPGLSAGAPVWASR